MARFFIAEDIKAISKRHQKSSLFVWQSNGKKEAESEGFSDIIKKPTSYRRFLSKKPYMRPTGLFLIPLTDPRPLF
jgi:hypothetical protein